MRLTRNSTLLFAAVVVFGVAGAAWACNVPVFRFAIERWRPDTYRAVLFHRGSLSAATSELIQPLHEQQDQGGANLSFRTIDPGELDPNTEEGAADAALFEALGKPDQPTLVVQYPLNLSIPTPLVTGPPDQGAIAR